MQLSNQYLSGTACSLELIEVCLGLKVCGVQDREMKRYPTVGRREYRPAGLTPQFLENTEDEPEYSDEDEDEAAEQARAALQRKRPLEEEEEVRGFTIWAMKGVHVRIKTPAH